MQVDHSPFEYFTGTSIMILVPIDAIMKSSIKQRWYVLEGNLNLFAGVFAAVLKVSL